MAINDSREQIIKKRGYKPKIHGDQYSLYLSNYPIAANYLATRLNGNTLLELCCGLGITLEALSSNFKRLIGVDIDSKVMKDCRKNLIESGVDSKVKLLIGDISDEKLLRSLKAEIVIYDIPYWVSKLLPDGGNVLDKNPDIRRIVNNIRKYVSKNIVIFAPPFLKYEKIKILLGDCEYEQIYINGKYDRNYIYFGNLIKNLGVTKKELFY